MRISDGSSDVCSSDLALNDAHGHAAGDAVLRRVCEILLRDTRASDVVGRLGGDEFGVILAQSGMEPAAAKAAKLAEAIAAEEVVWEGQALRITVAYGVHTLSSGQEADAALDRKSTRLNSSH